MEQIILGTEIFKLVRKRDGRLVPFDQERITRAILKAMAATGEGGLEDASRVSDRVMKDLRKKYLPGYILGIEEIQDMVETALITLDYAKAAKAYIIYRQKRAEVRDKSREIPERLRKLAEESKKYFRNPLGEFIYYRTYSRWIESENRRETWLETVDRFMNFMRENLADKLSDEEYAELKDAILSQRVMPSMRLLWSAGEACRKNHATAYNCSFLAIAELKDFAEVMFLAMSGLGVGFSVEQQNVQMLPQIKRQTGEVLATHTIEDSKEGWANALTLGLRTWFDGKDINFDFSVLRPAGARLRTMGGKSSGPGPLRDLLEFARRKILAHQGRRLNPIDVYDIVCKIGEIVVAGGVRRTALISLSDLDDSEMRTAKNGKFYLTEPQRSMANNSVAYNEKPSATQFLDEWLALAKSGSGERGIFNRGGLKKQIPSRRWPIFEPDAATSGLNPCVTGDTLVYVADGRGNVPIKQLAEEGRDVPVFAFNNKGRLVIRTMRNPRLTGRNLPVYKITLDDGSAIKATSNHKFRLKSGEYKEVHDLLPGDSLAIVTKFEASIKDLFPEANSRSQDYWWSNIGGVANEAEHRLIAGFHYNTIIHKGYIVHHKDRNAQNNNPENLEIMSKRQHDAIHRDLMMGDGNPMRRAIREWDEKKWLSYKTKHSVNNKGEKNKNFSGVSNEELKKHALALTGFLGRRFSYIDWYKYAKENHLPQFMSKWRRNHLGGILGLAKWAAEELGIDHIDTDPRSALAYKRYTSEGYNCEIVNHRLLVIKNCEICGREFRTVPLRREYGLCSISCGLKRQSIILKRKWEDENHRLRIQKLMKAAHEKRKRSTREKQTKIYSDLKFVLRRDPLKDEWVMACREKGASPEISRISSPFRNFEELKESAGLFNHKVVSVEFDGYEDVYNGTVDEFHNFFVGGFVSTTKNNKRKFIYVNNLQCGEINLKGSQLCNLTNVISRFEDAEETLLQKIRLATILGTYQSMLTDFTYISPKWKKNCDEERLLGVSIDGEWDSPAVRNPDTLRKMREKAIETNQIYAKRFGINESTAITCVKPSGNTSQLVDAASGMHPRHSRYYIRRVRISASDSLFQMLKDQKLQYRPEVGQSIESATTYVLEFPVKAPEGTVFKNDLTAIEQLEYWKMVKENYTEHNPSVTVSVGEDEWIAVANWLYLNWDILGGLSFLPREDKDHVYVLAPYEEISEEKYNELAANFPDIDFSQIIVYEKEDETEGAKELACVAGVCEPV